MSPLPRRSPRRRAAPGRRRGLLTALACLGVLLGTAAVIVTVFRVGMLTGLALAGAGFVVCAAPAHRLGLPIPSLGGLASLVGLLARLVSGLASAVLWLLRAPFD